MNSISFNNPVHIASTQSFAGNIHQVSQPAMPETAQQPQEAFSASSESSLSPLSKPVLALPAQPVQETTPSQTAPIVSSELAAEGAKSVSVKQGASLLPPTQATAASAAATDPEMEGYMKFYTSIAEHEPKISAMVKDIADSQSMGMEGFEYRLKGWDSFLRKIKSKGPDYEVKDVIRYTMTAPADALAQKVLDTMKAMEEQGCKTVIVKNTWDDPTSAYKGINTTVQTPDGTMFELQYHTPESYAMKDSTHKIYEELRVLPDPDCSRAVELTEMMMESSKSLERPAGVERVENRR